MFKTCCLLKRDRWQAIYLFFIHICIMPQTKIEGKFYPLTSEVAKKLIDAKLTAGEWRLWSYLVSLDPWGDRYEDLPSTLTIMEEVGIKKSTFYAAITKFQKHELFDFQDKGFAFRNLRGIPKIRKSVREIGNDSENSETIPKIRKDVREIGNSSENSENQSPEPSQSEDSNSPQTIQTYSDFKDSLSESERENFLSFVKEKTKNLSQPINDIEAWLASKNQAQQNRWEVYYENFLASLKSQGLDPQKPPIENKSQQAVKKLKEEIEQQRQRALLAWEKKQLEKRCSNDSEDNIARLPRHEAESTKTPPNSSNVETTNTSSSDRDFYSKFQFPEEIVKKIKKFKPSLSTCSKPSNYQDFLNEMDNDND
jgi:hypothetical protein